MAAQSQARNEGIGEPIDQPISQKGDERKGPVGNFRAKGTLGRLVDGKKD